MYSDDFYRYGTVYRRYSAVGTVALHMGCMDSDSLCRYFLKWGGLYAADCRTKGLKPGGGIGGDEP